jgi:hypothetical protein
MGASSPSAEMTETSGWRVTGAKWECLMRQMSRPDDRGSSALDEIYDVEEPDTAISFLPVLPNATFKGCSLV